MLVEMLAKLSMHKSKSKQISTSRPMRLISTFRSKLTYKIKEICTGDRGEAVLLIEDSVSITHVT